MTSEEFYVYMKNEFMKLKKELCPFADKKEKPEEQELEKIAQQSKEKNAQ